MVQILLLNEVYRGMNNILKPKGRKNLPLELINFGRHLVYAEGTKTEPFYIESIKKEIAQKYKCNQNDIELIIVNDGKTYNTKYLVNYALNDIDKRLKINESIDHVWIFFDKDDFPKSNFLEAHNKIESLNNSSKLNNDGFKYNLENGITFHSCFSNESFELWYCLYFDFYEGKHSREDYIKLLNKKLQSYKKNQKNMHQFLTSKGGNIDFAIKNAKKLSGLKNKENPSTNVYMFAEYFKSYMK